MGLIRTDIQTGIATLTIDNVARRNAMSLQMWRDLKSSIQALDQNNAVRVIIVRGEGHEAFVSGADISEFGQLRHSPESVRIYDETVEDAEAALLLCRKPVIAAIVGVLRRRGAWHHAGMRFAICIAQRQIPDACRAPRIGVWAAGHQAYAIHHRNRQSHRNAVDRQGL